MTSEDRLTSEGRHASPNCDRMPPLQPEQMIESQRQAAAAVIAGPRGRLEGPFIPLLRSPVLMERLQKTGEYLRFESVLCDRLREFTILLVARQWTQNVVWAIHHPLALQAGVAEAVTEALAAGRRPTGMTDDEEIAYELCCELRSNHCVSDATYQRALKRLGEQGVIDLLGVIGYYTLIAMVMNVARTPAPAEDGGRLAPFPG